MQSTRRFREREVILQENKANFVLGSIKTYDPQDRLLGTSFPVTGGVVRSWQFERTWDNKNPRSKRGVFMTGGPFYNAKATLGDATRHPITLSSKGYSRPGLPAGYYRVYNGVITNPIFNCDPITFSNYSKVGFGAGYYEGASSVDGYDALAWSRTRPKLEKGGAGQALAELRSLPSMLRQSAKGFSQAWKELSRTGRFDKAYSSEGGKIHSWYKPYNLDAPTMMPNKAASHYLNHQFGWVPFIKDLLNMFDILENSQKYIAQITRDNNSWVKRKRVLEKTNTTTEICRGYTSGCDSGIVNECTNQMVVSGVPCYSYFVTSSHVIDVTWAVGSFKYYRPEFDDSLAGYASAANVARQQLILHGVRINPSLLYKITPWSWLNDWFTNVGTVVDNASSAAEDSIVSRYLYCMKHTIKQIEQVSTFNFFTGMRSFAWYRTLDIKQRKVSDSPYGFALPGNLSAKQLSILLALGLDRTIKR